MPRTPELVLEIHDHAVADIPRTRELVREIHEHARYATRLLAEYVDPSAHRGTGVRRDANSVLRDVRVALRDLQEAADKLREYKTNQ